MAGFRAARRSYDESERALALDPSCREAGLVVGTYRYIVSTLSFPMRLMAYVAGFGGGRERGLRMVEEAAAAAAKIERMPSSHSYCCTTASIGIDDAMRVLDGLRRRYPRNRLVLLEAGATAARERTRRRPTRCSPRDSRSLRRTSGRRFRAKRRSGTTSGAPPGCSCSAGKTRSPICGGRWRPTRPMWVQGRAHLELARLALAQGDRAGAKRSAASAVAACEAGHDPVCVEEAKRVK